MTRFLNDGNHHTDHKNLDEGVFRVIPVGMKIVLFNDKLETANNCNPFYSMFDDKGKIIGT